MDVTNVFKATVKALKSRRKKDIASNNNNNVDLKHPLAKQSNQKEDFDTKAKNVMQNISKLKEFLLLHRKEYVSAGSHLLNGSKMEDAERDQIDQDSEKIIKACQETIKHLKQEASAQKVLPQVRQHRDSVFLLIETYLKSVCKMYSEQIAVRVKRVVDRKRISRLEPELRFRGSMKKNATDDPLSQKISTTTKVVEGESESEVGIAKVSTTVKSTDAVKKASKSQSWEGTSSADEDDELSTEEAQMFEQENQALVEEMNSLMSEVKEIEGKVVEVSRLQEIFAEKVWDQEKEIDQISHVVAGTSENIISGNEQIREAMKNNAGFRVWILFFIVVCTFALLFLDWYNN